MDEDAEGMEGDHRRSSGWHGRAVADSHLPVSDMAQAKAIYDQYAGPMKKRFKWINSALFKPELAANLSEDTDKLRELLRTCGPWRAADDHKLQCVAQSGR